MDKKIKKFFMKIKILSISEKTIRNKIISRICTQ